MRIMLGSICLLFALSTICLGQQVSLVAPFAEAELLESASGIVFVQVKLRAPDSDTEAQASLDDLQFVDCTGIVGTRRAAVPLAGISTEMLRTCRFEIGTANNTVPADWNKLALELKYRVRQNGVLGPPITYNRLSPITRCIRVSDVTATLELPTRTGDREITVPIKLNADVRLNVELKTPLGEVVATPSGDRNDASVLFENANQFQPVVLKVISGKTLVALSQTYSLSLSQMASQPPVTVQLKGVPASFTVNSFVPYAMSDPRITVKDDGSRRVEFSTSPASGSMQVFLNGRADPVHRDTQSVNRDFIIPANLLSAGVNTLTFTGEGFENRLKLSRNDPITFNVDPVTYLVDKPVVFDYDEANNSLKIRFALSRPLGTRWRFKDSLGLGADVQGPTNGVYEALIPLAMSQQNAALVDSKLVNIDQNSLLKRAPVEIEIYNATRSTEVVAAFVINFIKPTTLVKDKLQAADTFLAQNKRDQAKAAIAEALGLAGSLTDEQKKTIEAIVSQFRQPGQSTKSKIFKALAIAGKFAAGMFGVPLI